MEQNHRPLKQRYYPMLGFGRFESASRFCTAFDELRHYLSPKSPRRTSFSIRQAPDFQQQMVGLDDGVGRLTWGTLLSQLSSVPGKP